jgi:hypothetical protein
LSLAQFGPAAIDSVPRLEMAAANDVPRMQRAALAALAAIRGRQDSQEPAPAANPVTDSRSPAVTVPLAPVPLATAPMQILSGPPPSADTAKVGPPGLWPTVPARGISLQEIGSDGATAEARLRHQAEPPRLPDVFARPIERSGEQATPRPASDSPKPAIDPPPLTDDAPLSLESPSGGAKAGPSQ